MIRRITRAAAYVAAGVGLAAFLVVAALVVILSVTIAGWSQ